MGNILISVAILCVACCCFVPMIIDFSQDFRATKERFKRDTFGELFYDYLVENDNYWLLRINQFSVKYQLNLKISGTTRVSSVIEKLESILDKEEKYHKLYLLNSGVKNNTSWGFFSANDASGDLRDAIYEEAGLGDAYQYRLSSRSKL